MLITLLYTQLVYYSVLKLKFSTFNDLILPLGSQIKLSFSRPISSQFSAFGANQTNEVKKKSMMAAS